MSISYKATQPGALASDMIAMNDMPDLTLEVLKDIRAELRDLRADTNERLDTLAERLDKRLDTLTEATRIGFAGVNQRIDSVLKIVGSHHTELEARVTRLELHVGLPHDH